MARAKISVGDDTPSGEPENGPKGPYITDKDDGSQSPAGEPVKVDPARRPKAKTARIDRTKIDSTKN
jgi:hypothetical protein